MSSAQTTAAQPEQSARPKLDDTTLVLQEIKYYERSQHHVMHALYADFRDVFDGWTKERFQNVHPEALRALKWTLRRGGINTGNALKQTAGALAHLAQLPCVEEGVWPTPPDWDQMQFLGTKFDPTSEAYRKQAFMMANNYQVLRQRQQPLQPQAPCPQVLPAQAPAQAPPGRGTPMQTLPAHAPAPAPAQAIPIRGPNIQTLPSQPLPATGPSQMPPPQGQQQPGHQLQSYQPQQIQFFGAARPPPYSAHPPPLHNKQSHWSAPQASNPFSQTKRKRSAMNPSGQRPKIRQGSGLRIVQNDRDGGYDHANDESEWNGDLSEDEDEDEYSDE